MPKFDGLARLIPIDYQQIHHISQDMSNRREMDVENYPFCRLQNVNLVDSIKSMNPIMDCKVANLFDEDAPL